MWMVTVLRKWENLELSDMPIFKLSAPKDQVGFIPVFETKEAALEFAKGNESLVQEIRFKS